jgi:hypothetical protein
MSPRDRTGFDELPPWQQRVLTYLGLGVEVSVRPGWYRVLAGLAAAVLAVGAVMALFDGRWFAALGAAVLTAVVGSGTRP